MNIGEIIRSLIIWIFGIITMLWWSVLAIVAGYFDKTGNLSSQCGAMWSKGIIWISRVKVLTEGFEHFGSDKPFIIVSNHQSAFDIFVLMSYLPINFKWLLKKELLSIPLFGRALTASQYIMVDRKNARTAIKSMKKAEETLHKGIAVTVFPEGTRSVNGTIGEFKRGAFVLASKVKAPIIPVSLTGTGDVMKKRGFIVNSHAVITIKTHPPIDISSLTPQQRKELPLKVQKIISSVIMESKP
jgi:1-acyl-sn-glycerol-3-phosphate acyltransferase